MVYALPQEEKSIQGGKEGLSCRTTSERIRDADQGTEMEFLGDNSFLFYYMKKDRYCVINFELINIY